MVKQKRYEDTDGKEYFFDIDEFKLMIHRKAGDKSRESVYHDLAEFGGIGSYDTIKTWVANENAKKRSNPGTIESIKKAAGFFGLDDYAFLLPASGSDFPKIFEKDKQLVIDTFRTLLEYLIENTKFVPVGEGVRERQIEYWKNREDTKKKIRGIHLSINQQSLETSSNIRNRLHKLLLESEDIIHDSNPEAWDRYVDKDVLWVSILQRYYDGNRKDVIHDSDITARIYVSDEIDFAEDLNLGGVVERDDRYDYLLNTPEDLDAFEDYGYHGDLDITPAMVYEHTLAQYLTLIFKQEFNDLF